MINTKLIEVKEKRHELQLEVAEEALNLWNGLSDNSNSSYLNNKQVKAFGSKFNQASIIYVPIRDLDGKDHSRDKFLTKITYVI